ncbi:2-oxoacid:ferredoxin oxidoreductase subunit beta [Desulfurococcaceae archaeon MEX13E-LK6-19]|nr:2-oxoacid:ferredoxin oxidoreductase subunit beta [Desulfurococcaceae archaeon MEX13E-LK6-19]
MAKHFSRNYLREEVLPTAFCPGCYNGIVMNALFKAFSEIGVKDLKNYVFVSGIGCSSWIPSPYIKADSLHTLHGRAIPVATGVKLANPSLEVIVIAGDGDLASIGGNHLLHAARRNMDLIVILVNNQVYGMTRGQMAPTTPQGFVTPTTPYGNPEYPMDIAGLIANTNANYVARWCVSNFFQLKESLKEVLTVIKRGFRFIEVYTPCITYIVRREGKTPGEKLKELMRKCIPIEKYNMLSDDEKRNYVPVGIFKREDKPGYIEQYKTIVEKARGVTQ